MTDQREIDIIWLINTVFLSLFDPTSISIIYYLHIFEKSIFQKGSLKTKMLVKIYSLSYK